MRQEPGKTEPRGKITCYQKAPVLWKSSIAVDDLSWDTTGFHYSLCFETKGLSVSALC
jgi:hypothetical protein